MDLKTIIKSQYHASLEMLGKAISTCTDSLWDDPGYKNRYWHISFHALFYTHLYLAVSEEEFVPWPKYREEYQFLGPLPWPPHKEPNIGEPYTKADLVEYLDFCQKKVDEKVASVDLQVESGFDWLPFDKLELQFYNIRHIQHHTGQLLDRLRTKEGIGVGWVGMKRLTS